MKINNQQLRTVFIFLLFLCTKAYAMNLWVPHDPMWWPFYTAKDSLQVFAGAEGGIRKSKAFNEDSRYTNVLKIWQPYQNAVAMLEGFDPYTCIGQRIAMLSPFQEDIIATFNIFSLTADLYLKSSAAIEFRYFFCDQWVLSGYIPFYNMALEDVCFSKDDTPFSQDQIDEFKAVVYELGGLYLDPWKRKGIGDIALFIDWFRDFKQHKKFLKNVRINWRIGVELPTGKRTDENELFSLPFGRDGSFAMPFGLGLEVTLGTMLRGCVDVQLTHTFDNTRPRRIKVAADQTELLLLAKTPVHRDVGLTQRFDIYMQFYRILGGLSCKAGYRFYKQGEDIVSFKTNDYPVNIANTAESLQDWTSHQYVFTVQYDFHKELDAQDACVVPQFELFVRIPFNGQRSAQVPTCGGIIAFDF